MSTTHGMSGTSIYNVWLQMTARCSNPRRDDYSNYGGRGVSVCNRWRKFENFYVDMGKRPKDRTIDRIDNDGNYEPSNCRWATRKEQNSNKRLYKTNKSGLSGVTHRYGKWRIRIRRNGINHYLGTTDDFFEACCLRKSGEVRFA